MVANPQYADRNRYRKYSSHFVSDGNITGTVPTVFSLCKIHEVQFDIWSALQRNQCVLRRKCTSLSSKVEVLAPLNLFFFLLDSPLGAWATSFVETSRSHFLDTPHSVELLWTRDQPVAETST
jgi:hypothetical protein